MMQQRVNDQAAYVLHRRDYQDSSLILDLFTQDFGRIGVLVKGAKKRRDIASFQIGNRLSVSWSGKSDLKILTQVDCQTINIPVELLSGLFYANELLLYLLPKADAYTELFNDYQQFLIQLSQLSEDDSASDQQQFETLLRLFEINLLTEIGTMLPLNVESDAGQAVEIDQFYDIDVSLGVTLAAEQQRTAYNYGGKELLAIQQRDLSTAKSLQAAKKILRQIIDFNLQGRTLQSRNFYQKLNLLKKKRH